MPIVPKVFVNQTEIAAAVRKVEASLRPAVVHIRYTVGEDWTGDASIFFRILLADHASQQPGLRELTQKIALSLLNEVKEEENGLQAYFNFRSVSEQATLKEPEWA